MLPYGPPSPPSAAASASARPAPTATAPLSPLPPPQLPQASTSNGQPQRNRSPPPPLPRGEHASPSHRSVAHFDTQRSPPSHDSEFSSTSRRGAWRPSPPPSAPLPHSGAAAPYVSYELEKKVQAHGRTLFSYNKRVHELEAGREELDKGHEALLSATRQRFEENESRFDAQEARLKEHDARYEALEARFSALIEKQD